MRQVWRSFVAMLATLLVLPAWPLTTVAADERCFAETHQCISGAFLPYWEAKGGLAVYGLPITPARTEQNRDTGETYLTQWFERNRFELHGDKVLLGRLGDDRLRQLGIDWYAVAKGVPLNECAYFQETGHSLCNQDGDEGFRSTWQRLGGLGQFGFPLAEPKTETNSSGDSVLSQWFERARFEWHPKKEKGGRVLLGLLGSEVRAGVGPRVRQDPREFALTLADLPKGYQAAGDQYDEEESTSMRQFLLQGRKKEQVTIVVSIAQVLSNEAEAQKPFVEAGAGGVPPDVQMTRVEGIGDEALLMYQTVEQGKETITLAVLLFRRANALGGVMVASNVVKVDKALVTNLGKVMASRVVVDPGVPPMD